IGGHFMKRVPGTGQAPKLERDSSLFLRLFLSQKQVIKNTRSSFFFISKICESSLTVRSKFLKFLKMAAHGSPIFGSTSGKSHRRGSGDRPSPAYGPSPHSPTPLSPRRGEGQGVRARDRVGRT